MLQIIDYRKRKSGDIIKKSRFTLIFQLVKLLYPPNNEVVGGYIGFTPSVRPSDRLSVRPSVRPSVPAAVSAL